MEKLGRGGRTAFVIGLLVLMQITNVAFVGRLAPVGVTVIAIYFLFVLWIWAAKSIGNLFLMFDRSARHSLRSGEKREAVVVGGGALGGVALFVAGLVSKQIGVIIVGLTLVAAAFPMSLVFTNRSKIGRLVFGVIGGGVYLGGLVSLLLAVLPTGATVDSVTALFGWIMILALISTWIGNIPALRR